MQLALRDAIEERAHLVFFSRNLKFHATIRQITDPPGHVETFGGVAHRPAKPDALNISLVENLERNHTRWLLSELAVCYDGETLARIGISIASSLHLYE